ncbi:MAG: hypothetical protein KGI69_02305 [Patescibacteria group bacterium]|nr:hypothetical protein [Patescibacteria group bacterium]
MLSHHANLLIGGASAHDGLVSALEKSRKARVRGDPDFIDRAYGTFAIGDARDLKALAATRPAGKDGRKIFVLTMDGITLEAQNALLKLLEEPPERAHFFLIVPSAHLLLPTVLSRLSLMDAPAGVGALSRKEAADRGPSAEARAFLAMAVPERLAAAKKLVDAVSKEKKTKREAIGFLDAVEAAVRERGVRENVRALEAIEAARRYADDRAPSLKMLLEYVALSV